jgi:hypothetical protein
MGFRLWCRLQWCRFWAWLWRGEPVWFKDYHGGRVTVKIAWNRWDPFLENERELIPYVTVGKGWRHLRNNGTTWEEDRWRYVRKERHAEHVLQWGELQPTRSR